MEQIIIHDRKTLEMSGVKNVSEFEKTKVFVSLSDSGLSIKGCDFEITQFDVSSGVLNLKGQINELTFKNNPVPLRKKIFK
ncbi:MAG: YabP/YqfC family sporulation protein [Clostridia bacterium]